MNLYQKKFERGITPLFFKKRLHDLKSLQLLNPQKRDKILEIGCHQGQLVKLLRKYSDFVAGVDINEAVIKSSPVKGLRVMSADNLKFADCFFDKVILVHTIEHIPDLQKAFAEIERVLKEDGLCVLIYPWEIIRGTDCLFSACFDYGDPFMIRNLHLHKLNPRKISRLTNLQTVKKGLFFGPYPTYYTSLRKKSAKNQFNNVVVRHAPFRH